MNSERMFDIPFEDDALLYADNIGVGLGETDQLHSIFDDAGLSGETGVDNAMNNPCMLSAGYAMMDYNSEQDV